MSVHEQVLVPSVTGVDSSVHERVLVQIVAFVDVLVLEITVRASAGAETGPGAHGRSGGRASL